MARSFNDATDRIDYTANWDPSGAAFSFSAWIYRTQAGARGYFWYRGSDDSSTGITTWHRGDVAEGTIELYRTGSTSGRRYSVAGALPANAWHHVIMTHDGTFNDATTMHIYVDGSEVSYGGSQNGSSEDSYAATYWCLGGRYYDDARNWGGYLAEMAIWNKVLSAGEIEALSSGYSPQFFLKDMKAYWPLVRDTLDRFNGDFGTLDGTAVVAHPPKVLYPAPPLFTVPAAVAADAMPMAMHYYRTMRA